MILDTNFVVDVLNGKEFAVSKLKLLNKENISYAITSPTIFELWSGITSIKKSEGDKQKMAALLR